MIRIERERDVEILRQVALLLDRENRHLHKRIEKLTIRLAQLEGASATALQLEIEQLKEILDKRNKTIFGDSSEKRPKTKRSAKKKSAPKTGHGPTAQPQLPVIAETVKIPDEKRVCPACEGMLEAMGDQAEESEEISVVQRRFVVVKRRRLKYRCRCNGAVVTAPAAPRLIPGGRYSSMFAVDVAISKYLDHAPLERQRRIMARQGLNVSTQTLWDQIEALGRVLEPSYEALRERVFSAPVVHADESHWRLMTRKGSSRWWVWSVASRDSVYYKLCDTRSEKSAKALLSGYQGIVMCDGYSAYKALAKSEAKPGTRAGPGLTLAHCWAHVRRKFVEAEHNYPIPCGRALDLIGELFKVERNVPFIRVPEPLDALAARRMLRTKDSKPVIADLRAWAEETRTTALPRSGLRKAIDYMLSHWHGLTLFLEDPNIPLDNNLAERKMRGVVLGRKNHYGSRSKRGTEVAAILYSLTESAKLVGAEPNAYLLTATQAALNKPGTVTFPTAPGA